MQQDNTKSVIILGPSVTYQNFTDNIHMNPKSMAYERPLYAIEVPTLLLIGLVFIKLSIYPPWHVGNSI